mgnify:CR=1 FL=1
MNFTFLRLVSLAGWLIISSSLGWTQYTTGAQKLAAFAQQKQRIATSPFSSLQWRLTGPNNRSGRSTDVIGVSGRPEIMYAAFAFSYAELSCAIPRAGGAFEYTTRAFRRNTGFITGMAQNIEFLFAPPAIAAGIGSYVQDRKSTRLNSSH